MHLHTLRISVPAHYGVRASIRLVIHDNFKSMRAELGPEEGRQTAGAFFRGLESEHWGHGRKTDLLGEIHVNARQIYLDWIAHEVAHAGVEWLRRDPARFITLAKDRAEDVEVEEKLASIQGSLVSRIVRTLGRLGLVLR